MANFSQDDRERGLRKQLASGQMAMVAVGGSIGTGLFLGSGWAIQMAGPAVIVSYLISTLIAWTVAIAIRELSTRHPAAGSFGVYAEVYLNDWAGFIARYGYWFSVVMAVGSEMVAAGAYMRVWYPSVPTVVWMLVFGILLLLINRFPVAGYATTEYWLAFVKVFAIFVFILAGAILMFSGRIRPQYFNNSFAPNGWSPVLLAVPYGLYSFLGIEMVAISSGEAQSAAQISRAMRITFFLLGFVYLGAMAVLVGVMPSNQAGVTQSPFVTVFRVARTPAAGFIMNLVVLSAAFSGANATLYAASRMLFSLARSGYAPQALGNLNRDGVPMAALLSSMMGIVVAILIQLGTTRAYIYIIDASLVGAMSAWLVSLAAHVRFRSALSPNRPPTMPLRYPLGVSRSIAGFIAIFAAIISTMWVPQLRPTIVSAEPYLVVVSAAYFLVRAVGRYLMRPLPQRVEADSLMVDERKAELPQVVDMCMAQKRLLRVFLCHSAADKPLVRDLYHRLKRSGFLPWLDEEDLLPGQDWQREIPVAVRACDVVVVCLSAASITKEGYVQKEINIALDVADEKPEGTIFVIPARLEAGFGVPSRLSRWQWVDLFEIGGYERLMRSLTSRATSLGVSVSAMSTSMLSSQVQASVRFFNVSGPPSPLLISEKQYLTQSAMIDLWGIVTIVNYSGIPVTVSPLRLFLENVRHSTDSVFFRLKSQPTSKIDSVRLLGHQKEDYELHFIFPDDNYPQSTEGELSIEVEGSAEPIRVAVKFS